MLIHKQIIQIMKEVEPVAKKHTAKTGAQSGYKFRGIDDLYEALQAIMAKNGVYSVPEVLEDRSEERVTRNGATMIYRILKIKYTFYAEDGSSVSSVVIGEGMDSGDKASNKAMSVAHKYCFLQVFCIPTVDPKDPEHDNFDQDKGEGIVPRESSFAERLYCSDVLEHKQALYQILNALQIHDNALMKFVSTQAMNNNIKIKDLELFAQKIIEEKTHASKA